jgi:poly-gamma-glutamate capsule biosynthesis protein CapA/YwtB (metallophosphatase superfamily)
LRRPLLLFLCILFGLLGLSAYPLGSAAFPRRVAATRPHPSAAVPSPHPLLPSDEAGDPAAVLRPALYDVPPQPLRLAIAPGAAAQGLGRALEQALARDACPVRWVAPGQPADVYLGYDPPPDFVTWPLTATRFVPVVSFWLPVTDVTYADLGRLFRGEVPDWARLGAPQPQAVVPLALRTDPPAPLRPAAGPLLTDTDALVSFLEQSPGGIALVPLEQVDVRMRALRVDGRDPLLEEGFGPEDPLVRRLYLAVSPQAPAMAAQRVAALARRQRLASPEPAIEVVVVGDIMPGRGVERRILAQGGDYTCPFADVAPELRWADLTIANLEGVLSADISPPHDSHTMLFVASDSFSQGLLDAGIDAVSLANNHSRNFGTAGLSDTISLLQGVGIQPFGAGLNLEEARRPALFNVRGVTFALLGYDDVSSGYYGAAEDRAGTAPADPAMIAADIAAAREQADVVIPYFHWGTEYTQQASSRQKELAHAAIAAGATVVLGNHPHWVQGLERYQGRLILYSLGNFVFDQNWSQKTSQGVIARLIFRGDRLVNVRLRAVQIVDYYQPVLLPAVAAEEVYRQIHEANPEWPTAKGVTR